MTTTIWVTTQFEGFHSWPDAPIHRAYLGEPHRHLFKVRVEVEVVHDDREVEFHDLLDAVKSRLPKSPDLGAQSCEMMAAGIATDVAAMLPGRTVRCEVSEDGECGAIAEISAPETAPQ